MPAINMIGSKFGRLTVISRAGSTPQRKPMWLCQCDCGREWIAVGASLRDGHTTSCGCLRLEKPNRLKHGHNRVNKRSKAYIVWAKMKQRCDDSNVPEYKNYGGRGITYDPQWEYFENFLNDMGEPPDGLTLDRKDNNKGYFKENCHWTTQIQQIRNRRNTKKVTYAGQTMTISELAECFDIPYERLYARIHRGMPIKQALSIMANFDT